MFINCKKKEFINRKLNYYKRKNAIKASVATIAKDAYRVSFVKLDQVLFCSLMSICKQMLALTSFHSRIFFIYNVKFSSSLN